MLCCKFAIITHKLTMSKFLENLPIHLLKCISCNTIRVCGLHFVKSTTINGMLSVQCKTCNTRWTVCFLHNCRYSQSRSSEAHKHFLDSSHVFCKPSELQRRVCVNVNTAMSGVNKSTLLQKRPLDDVLTASEKAFGPIARNGKKLVLQMCKMVICQ